jgi:hypothetical protein
MFFVITNISTPYLLSCNKFGIMYTYICGIFSTNKTLSVDARKLCEWNRREYIHSFLTSGPMKMNDQHQALTALPIVPIE